MPSRKVVGKLTFQVNNDGATLNDKRSHGIKRGGRRQQNLGTVSLTSHDTPPSTQHNEYTALPHRFLRPS
ncbi:hypothetical protein PM082_007885 [Marasmius tenuissimus]|nr:hypothetical protein PM082_007885 [Marasmius tenuissimus]